MTAPPVFDGPVVEHRQGTFINGEDVSFGVAQVHPDRVVIHVSDSEGELEILSLHVGDEGEAFGAHVRLCGLWVDPDVDEMAPGSDESKAYYVWGWRDSAPDCPKQITTDA